ncbi:MAG: hypothetical protein ACHQ2F_08740 [Desulfobaccales bacterium]
MKPVRKGKGVRLRAWIARLCCFVGILGLTLLFSSVTLADSAQEAADGDVPQGLQLLPRVGLSMEYGGYIAHQDNFTSQLRRRLEIDLLQYRRHIFYVEFDERTYFGIPDNKWQFNLFKYDITLGGYRYDFGDFYLGAFVRHQCNNLFDTITFNTSIDRQRANLYGAGPEFLTKNMRLGMKDRGINFDSPQAFEFLNHWGAGFSASKLFVQERINANWLIKGQVRYDIFRYRQVVPYVEATGEVLAGSETRGVPSVELGARLHLGRFDLTPFFKWSREQESLLYQFNPDKTSLVARNSLLGGARLETLLDGRTFGPTPGASGLQLFPEMHGQANYAAFLNNPHFQGNGNIELDLEALRWNSWTLFFYTDLNFDTRKEDLKPDKVSYWLQYGLTYSWERYFIEGFVKDDRRLDSNIFRGTMERANLAGLRTGTKGMKPGHYNDGISFTGPASFEFINNWNAQAYFGHFFNNRDWQYLWNLNAQVRWDLLRWYFMVPYVQGEVNWMSGGGSTQDALEYAVEPGVRLHGVLDLAVYYRFQHRKNVLFFGGPSENENLVGVKVLF